MGLFGLGRTGGPLYMGAGPGLGVHTYVDAGGGTREVRLIDDERYLHWFLLVGVSVGIPNKEMSRMLR